MRIDLITSDVELQRLAGDWRRLADEAVLAGPDWLIPWWQHLGSRPRHDGRLPRLATLAVRGPDDELIAVAPWYLDESRWNGRTLRLLGSGSACTDYLTIPCQAGKETAVAAAIADWLFENQRGAGFSWDLLSLEAIDLTDRMYSRLIKSLDEHEAINSIRPAGNCWRVPLSGTWEEYVATLSKTNRKKVRRLDRSYLQTGRAKMLLTTTPEELSAAFDLLVALHTKRWQSRGEAGIFAEPGVLEFHREAMSRLLAAGQLRLASLEIDGRPAASEYCIGGGATLYSY